jgi:hypothetical protein
MEKTMRRCALVLLAFMAALKLATIRIASRIVGFVDHGNAPSSTIISVSLYVTSFFDAIFATSR